MPGDFSSDFSSDFGTTPNVWTGAVSSDANVAGNWSLGRVPIDTDIATWDGTVSVVNCTLSATMSVMTINVLPSYTGTIALGTYAVSGGDMSWKIGTGGTVNFGSSTITCSGNFSWASATGTITRGTSTVVMTGWNKQLALACATTRPGLYNFTIADGAWVTVPTPADDNGAVFYGMYTLNGRLTFNGYTGAAGFFTFGGFTQGTHGSMDGTGGVYWGNGTLTLANPSAISPATIICRRNVQLPPGTYTPTTYLRINLLDGAAYTYTWSAGPYTFACPFEIYQQDGAHTISGANNPTLIFQQSVTVTQTTGDIAFTNPSTNPVQFTGTANQTINMAGKTGWGTVVVNKPAAGSITWTSGDTITAGGAWAMTSLTQPAGVTMDMGDGGWTHTISGDVTLAGAFDMGNSTVRCGGNFSNAAVTSWTYGDGILVMTGAGKTLATKGTLNKDFSGLTINLGATITATTSIEVYSVGTANQLTVNGLLSIASGKQILTNHSSVSVGASGVVQGTGKLYLYNCDSGKGFLAQNGSVTVSTLWFRAIDSAGVIVAGTYSSSSVVFLTDSAAAYTWRPSGAYSFGGNVEYWANNAGGSLTIDNATNNPNISVGGNVTFTQSAGTLTYTAGSGTLTLTGGNSTITTLGKTLESINVNKTATANTLTLADSLNCASFTLTQGTLVPSGKSIAATGAITIGVNGQVSAATLAGATWTAAAFSATGEVGDLLTLNPASPWTATFSGRADASYVNVANSNAGGGSTVFARKSTNSGSNTNWVFYTRRRRILAMAEVD